MTGGEAAPGGQANMARKRSSVASDDLPPLPNFHQLGARRASKAVRPSLAPNSKIFRHRTSVSDVKVQYENTYKTAPDIGTKFSPSQAKEAIQSILSSYLSQVMYEASECSSLTVQLADMVKRELRDLDLKRYKLIVNVFLVQLKNQGMEVASRCLGDKDNDNFVSVEHSVNDIRCVVVVHACYFE